MAVVNVDLSEYDAIRNRNKELEEQVKELKKLNESLKNDTKVILRKETVVGYQDEFRRFRPSYGPDGRIDDCRPDIRRIVESHESYINFEDVRLKVENQMREEVERSIKDNKSACERYLEKYNSLDADFQKKKAELDKKEAELEKSFKKKLQEENGKMRDEYKDSFAESERKRNELILCLNRIVSLADIVASELGNSLFPPRKTINKVMRISEIATNKKV